ncbi:Truncated CD47-like protein, integral membrane protein [Eptesipox virus]|uniref:Truncated CD47-like protein, integral membrane protein n=1 Tax=Eptesipox virus TaxID=1329402 RepID=A0A220T6K4_9POXV|nr:Truncated CD47-like protein, integral membrane protein [Eptesipox virus]ASK51338.1 Truncated CD47-like protein, integral membrane protein [Eptesipox virus]WAH71096.1 truncated CD47-like protein, integral membrane protein [Eptesipox virus]
MDKLFIFCFILQNTILTNKTTQQKTTNVCNLNIETIIFISCPIINIILLSCNILTLTKRIAHIKKVLHLYVGCLWVTFITFTGLCLSLTDIDNDLIKIYGISLIMFSSILIIVIQYNILYNIKFTYIFLIYLLQIIGYGINFIFYICYMIYNYKVYFTVALIGQCLIALQECLCLIILFFYPIKTIYEYTSIPF